MTRTRLGLTALEDRTAPATFGTAWPDARNLSLSFAPDGTAVVGAPSTLTQLLGAANAPAWQTAALRAFQTWAQYANVDLHVVADGGQAFDAAGAPQGDTRFGDVRIAARPLGAGLLALGSPYDPMAGTHSGDVRLNSAVDFGPGGYDLFSVMLHEAGHVLGLAHSDDPASPMYAEYGGVRTGPTAEDIIALRNIYGPRTPDRNDRTADNDILARATPLPLVSLASGNLGAAADADITAADDRDVYRVHTSLILGGLVVLLHTSGESLLQGRVRVYDAAGNVVASAAEADPLSGDVAVVLPNAQPLSTYFVAVDGWTDDAFGVGSYRVEVQQLPLVNNLLGWLNGAVTQLVQPIAAVVADNDFHLNDTPPTATVVPPLAPRTDGRFDYTYRGAITDQWDVDFYRLRVPSAESTLTAQVWRVGAAALGPRVRVFNGQGEELAAEVLVNDGDSYTVQLRDATPGANYIVKVEGRNQSTGQYHLGVEFAPRAVTPTTLLQGAAGTAGGTLQMNRVQLVHFLVESPAATLTVTDAAGTVVLTLTANGETVTRNVWLPAGSYEVRVVASDAYRLRAIKITDPIGPQPGDPTGDPYGGDPPPANSGPPDQSTFWTGGGPGGGGGNPIYVA